MFIHTASSDNDHMQGFNAGVKAGEHIDRRCLNICSEGWNELSRTDGRTCSHIKQQSTVKHEGVMTTGTEGLSPCWGGGGGSLGVPMGPNGQ